MIALQVEVNRIASQFARNVILQVWNRPIDLAKKGIVLWQLKFDLNFLISLLQPLITHDHWFSILVDDEGGCIFDGEEAIIFTNGLELKMIISMF